jgi:membrane-associated protease RseP (regulator of RpoE activity)
MDPQRIKGFVEEVMIISGWDVDQNAFLFKGELRRSAEAAMAVLRENLRPLNLIPLLSKKDNQVILSIRFLREPKKSTRPAIHVVLFALTVLSTLFVGSLHAQGNPLVNPSDLLKGIPFSFSILLILGSHELGHFFTSQHNRVDASLPYFLPFPHLFGTFGAFIRMRSPIPDKKTLVRIGAAGPLIGLAFAIPIVVIGLKLSQTISLSELETMPSLSLGNSILFSLIAKSSVTIPEGHELLLHPVAFAGWAGILVTGLNLMPVGQLDGGHIGYGILGKYHKWLARVIFFSLLPLGLQWPGWWIWAALLFFLGIQHPLPLDDITPLGTRERIVGWLCLALFLLTFTPIPLRLLP